MKAPINYSKMIDKKPIFSILWLVFSLMVLPVFSFAQASAPKWNDMQVIGSHNSYKIAIDPPLLAYMRDKDSAVAISLQYEHPSLSKQLNLGLRNLELDVFYDPNGGYYSNPKGLDIERAMGAKPSPYDPENKLEQPGLKLFHIQDIDFRSHHLLFRDALKELLEWSANNPGHIPVIVLINAKDGEIPQTRKPLKFSAEALDSLDMEIRSVFSNKKLITPDLVRGSSNTLEEAVLDKGWPELQQVKGRFLFVLDEKEVKINSYLENFPLLKGGALFVNSKEGNPEAGFRILNDPITDFKYIRDLVKKGYMVRTRADTGTHEARINDYERFEKAKASGAQVISTDYYIPSKLFDSSYQVIFSNGKYQRIKQKQK